MTTHLTFISDYNLIDGADADDALSEIARTGMVRHEWPALHACLKQKLSEVRGNSNHCKALIDSKFYSNDVVNAIEIAPDV